MRYILVAFCVLSVSSNVFAQAKVRKLPNSINHPSINVFSPYVSADGNSLVYISDNAEDNILTPFYTFREGSSDWRTPQVLPKIIYSSLSFLRGYSLSADGKKILYSTMKSPGVGGFDLWWSEWKGSTWSEPANFFIPINSKGHEGSPSLTTDGNTLYFMRCEKMDQSKADNCKIFKASKKPNGQWDEPVELPTQINTGNSQAPRIMADGETLIFSSNKMETGKGGMDLYMTRLINNSWSKPIPLDFVNTEKDDQYVSVTALGRYLLRDSPGARKSELVEYLIPNELRPKGMMKLEGKITSGSMPLAPSYISVVDLVTNKRIHSSRPAADGSFLIYLREGTRYELSIDPEQNNVSYFAKVFDLTSDKIPQVERFNATLKPLNVGDELALEMIAFKPGSSNIDMNASANELKRFLRLANGNPSMKFEFQILLNGYKEDGIRSDVDLTELVYDSIQTQYEKIDSLGQPYQRDTVMVKTRYHNDRTHAQAKALIDYFVKQGVSETRFSYRVNAIPATLPEDKKLTVKAIVRAK
jgi:hypothetical protein